MANHSHFLADISHINSIRLTKNRPPLDPRVDEDTIEIWMKLDYPAHNKVSTYYTGRDHTERGNERQTVVRTRGYHQDG